MVEKTEYLVMEGKFCNISQFLRNLISHQHFTWDFT